MADVSGPPTISAGAVSGIGDDMLEGADSVSQFLWGENADRQRLYRLIKKRGVPIFRIGTRICARKSRLLAWIEAQETASTI